MTKQRTDYFDSKEVFDAIEQQKKKENRKSRNNFISNVVKLYLRNKGYDV